MSLVKSALELIGEPDQIKYFNTSFAKKIRVKKPGEEDLIRLGLVRTEQLALADMLGRNSQLRMGNVNLLNVLIYDPSTYAHIKLVRPLFYPGEDPRQKAVLAAAFFLPEILRCISINRKYDCSNCDTKHYYGDCEDFMFSQLKGYELIFQRYGFLTFIAE